MVAGTFPASPHGVPGLAFIGAEGKLGLDYRRYRYLVRSSRQDLDADVFASSIQERNAGVGVKEVQARIPPSANRNRSPASPASRMLDH